MVVIPGLSSLLEAAGKYVSSWNDSGSRLVVDAGSVVQSAVCPRCTCSSSRPHGRYRRWVADCPSFGQPVTLAVEVRRFKCVNPGCTRRTFTERIETLVAAGQRRTLRLVEAVCSLGYALGGEPEFDSLWLEKLISEGRGQANQQLAGFARRFL